MARMLRAFLIFLVPLVLPGLASAGKFEDIEKTAQHFEAVALMLETTAPWCVAFPWRFFSCHILHSLPPYSPPQI